MKTEVEMGVLPPQPGMPGPPGAERGQEPLEEGGLADTWLSGLQSGCLFLLFQSMKFGVTCYSGHRGHTVRMMRGQGVMGDL